MEEGGAREVGAETAETLSHGNCKCNHWNKNWLSSDVKRRVSAGGVEQWKKQKETGGKNIRNR